MIAAIYARIPLATLGGLLALATPASAGCAWVVWGYFREQEVDRYSVQLARPTRSACDEVARNFATVLKA